MFLFAMKVLNGWIGHGNASLDSTSSPVPGGNSLLLSEMGDGAANSGFGNEGLYLVGGKEYEGYLVLQSANAATITVSLLTSESQQASLATTTLSFAGGEWSEVPFRLTPSASAECVGIDNAAANKLGIGCPINNTYNPQAGMSDRSAHICVRCGGKFSITLASGGPINVGFASLMPGAWGRYKGLPVRLDAALLLQKMGIRAMRQGGSFADDADMKWTNWRGTVWRRPSAGGKMNRGLRDLSQLGGARCVVRSDK